LPCGFLYGALAAAAGTGSAAAGALALASFALGTVPALLLVGFAGAMAARRAKAAVGRIVPGLLLFNAAVLLWLAWRAVVQASG
jgi:sulfite exporter TauE/SafE